MEKVLSVGRRVEGSGVGGDALRQAGQQRRQFGKAFEPLVREIVGFAVLGQAALGKHEVGRGSHAHIGFAVANHQHALVARRGFALAVAGGGAAGVAGIREVDAPAVLVDLAQPVGEDRQQGHVVARKNPRDALLDAVADHFDGSAQAQHVVDEVREVRVDLDAVEVFQQLGRGGLDERQLAAQAFA